MLGLLLAGMSVCSVLPGAIDALIQARTDGVSADQARATILAGQYDPQIERKLLGAVTIIYVNAPTVDDQSRRDQILLACDNREVINGYQERNLRDHPSRVR